MVHLQLIPSNKKYGLIREPHDCTTYFSKAKKCEKASDKGDERIKLQNL